MSDRSELENQGAEFLRARGFQVTRFSDHRRSLTIGWVDMVAVRFDQVWFLETKTKNDRIRPSQKKFRRELEPHLGDHVHYKVINALQDFVDVYHESL